MSNYLNYRLVGLIFLSMLLLACSSEDKPNAGNNSPEESVFLKAYVSEKASVDLNVKNSIDIRLKRELDDSTEEEVNLVLTWSNDRLILSDNSGSEIDLEYDATALDVGETTLKFVDPVSMRDVEVTVELIKENSSVIDAIIENGPVIELNINESVELNLIRKLSDNTEQRSILILTSEEELLTLKDNASGVMITLVYDAGALASGEASASFNDLLSTRGVIFTVKLIKDDIPSTVVTQVQIQGNAALIDLNGSTATELSLIRKFDDNTEEAVTLILAWEIDKLMLKNKASDNLILLTYNEEERAVGKTTVMFEDPVSKLNVGFELTFIDIIRVIRVDIESHALTIHEGNSLQLSVKLTYSNDDIKFNEFDLVKCQSMSAVISVTAECLVSANSLGLAAIKLVMEEGNAELMGSEIEVVARPYGDLSEGSTFSIVIPTSGIIHYEIKNTAVAETYKVVLSGALLPEKLKLEVKPSSESNNVCSNLLFLDVLDPRVACGVKTEEGKLYLRIAAPFVFEPVEAEINVSVDNDILLYDGPVKAESSRFYQNNYDFAGLSLGVLRDGHVPANSSGSNVSRYYSNEALGMVPDFSGNGDYTVSIAFDSLNFDEDSAIIRWFVSNLFTEFPTGACKPDRDINNANMLTCKIENLGQTDLFVEVLGNPPGNPTSIDGEISYTILLNHSLRN